MSKPKARWTAVSFGYTPLTGVVYGHIGDKQDLLQFNHFGDFPATVVSHAQPFASFVANNSPELAAINPGRQATIRGTHVAGKQAIGYRMCEAIIESTEFHGQVYSMKLRAISPDGTTSPISLTLEDSPRVPDALMFPSGTYKKCQPRFEQITQISGVAEESLEIDRSAGFRAFIRIQPEGRCFVTRSIDDTINFPHGHEKAYKPRYRWEIQPDGIEYGYLV